MDLSFASQEWQQILRDRRRPRRLPRPHFQAPWQCGRGKEAVAYRRGTLPKRGGGALRPGCPLHEPDPAAAKMTAEWKMVIAIDANSSMAKMATAHLNGK
jgi:hypothetical protein